MSAPVFYNAKALSARLGLGAFVIKAMKRAALEHGETFFSHGRRTTMKAALKWIDEHPDFKSTSYGRATPPASPKRRQRQIAVSAGK